MRALNLTATLAECGFNALAAHVTVEKENLSFGFQISLMADHIQIRSERPRQPRAVRAKPTKPHVFAAFASTLFA